MEIIVAKFGGMVLATDESMKQAILYLKEEIVKGKKVAVVVSARGKRTDELISLMPKGCSKEEYDQKIVVGEKESQFYFVQIANTMGVKVKSLSVFDIDFKTTGNYGDAKPNSINKKNILEIFENFDMVVIPGFFGISENNDGTVTTLGRGGSDTTAVCLAATLNAKCYFFKQANGITAFDPNIDPRAKVLKHIKYSDAKILTEYGYGFLTTECLKIAEKYNVHLEFRSSPSFGNPNESGTIISANGACDTENLSHFPEFQAIAVAKDITACMAYNVPNKPGESKKFFSLFSNGFLDAHQAGAMKSSTISVIGKTSDIDKNFNKVWLEYDVQKINNLSCIMYINTSMGNYTDFFKRISTALAKAGINIVDQYSSGEKIHILVNQKKTNSAVTALAYEFGLLEKK